MVNYVKPHHSKSRVNAAGARVRDENENTDDIAVIENWRAAHAYVLNTFQSHLRQRSKKYNYKFVQRLKRRDTIFDKLKRNKSMQLSRMHDIAGCRLIFEDEKDLHAFRVKYHQSRFKHILKIGENDKYNYIKYPKSSGYRGVHDVFEYNVRSQTGTAWNGLHIEIQYRTKFQHAWATAVEVADFILSSRIKFSNSTKDYERFFILASEIITRTHESRYSCCPDLTDQDLCSEFVQIDNRLGLTGTFGRLKQADSLKKFTKNMLLIFDLSKPSGESLEVKTFDSVNRAMQAYDELESTKTDSMDIVLVRADVPDDIRYAFRNYWSDTSDFVAYVNDGLDQIEHSFQSVGRQYLT